MPDHFSTKVVSEPTRAVPSTGALNHVRAAALVATLVPLAQVVATPVTLSANQSGCTSAAPCPVPEPGSILSMAGIAAFFIRNQLRKK